MTTTTATTSGSCAERFAGLRQELERQLASGAELGASIAVVVDGEPVVDLWGGHRDPERTRAWESDTLVNVFSITKTMTALSALLLVDRGELDVRRKVAHYWPEFAANGKGDIEIRHILGHTSGVSGWQPPMQVPDLYDTEAAAALLAAQPPWWTPGSASAYHCLNYGHLVDAVIRRIAGRSLGLFFAEELAGPLGADFHIGTAAAHRDRIAPLVPPPALEFDLAQLDQDSILVKTLTSPLLDVAMTATPGWQQAEIGAVNGHGNARSVARVQSLVANGGRLDGRQFLSEETIDLIFEQQSDGIDLALMVPLRFGIGYGLPQPQTAPEVPQGRVCWWSGYGGSIVVNDLDRRMTFAYTMNKMEPGIIGSARADAYLRATYAAVRG
ncbi:serine hydrolase domain-containing protein [Nocardia sp. NPDC127579]|uniref:serine hydrolase domain-containing protein n=1 Tax=Nocardia sp. NPDC127579 TaxID=3345402 RepID=UPI003637000E